jgi:hypothetical protein
MAMESFLGSNKWLNKIGDWYNPRDSECESKDGVESDIVHHNVMNYVESHHQEDACIGPTILILIWPIPKSKRDAELGLVMVNGMQTRRNKRRKKM